MHSACLHGRLLCKPDGSLLTLATNGRHGIRKHVTIA